MIRQSYCPKCCQITNQKTTKHLNYTKTVCERCFGTLKTEYPPRKPSQSVKARKPMNMVSPKMAVQRRGEKKLEQKLMELCQNRCEICNQSADFRGLHKHEIIRRGQQGNELEPTNCLILCLRCHDHRKYPLTGTPLSVINQQDLANRLHASVK